MDRKIIIASELQALNAELKGMYGTRKQIAMKHKTSTDDLGPMTQQLVEGTRKIRAKEGMVDKLERELREIKKRDKVKPVITNGDQV